MSSPPCHAADGDEHEDDEFVVYTEINDSADHGWCLGGCGSLIFRLSGLGS